MLYLPHILLPLLFFASTHAIISSFVFGHERFENLKCGGPSVNKHTPPSNLKSVPEHSAFRSFSFQVILQEIRGCHLCHSKEDCGMLLIHGDYSERQTNLGQQDPLLSHSNHNAGESVIVTHPMLSSSQPLHPQDCSVHTSTLPGVLFPQKQ